MLLRRSIKRRSKKHSDVKTPETIKVCPDFEKRRQEILLLAKALHSNQWIPRNHKPTIRQAEFLYLPDREALYGGAAGGGKSDALLMGALQFVDVPMYSAILFRKTFSALTLPGALIPRAAEWLCNTAARWNDQKKQWIFPSKSVIQFGYCELANDIYRYQSSEFQYAGFDELTQFTEEQYRYIARSRLRKHIASEVPLRARGASNPGGVGHVWVFDRFVIPGAKYPYIPAKLEDNPYLDQEEYIKDLEELDETTKRQLRHGQWVTDPENNPYQTSWWRGKNRFDPVSKTYRKSVVARYLSYDTAVKNEKRNAKTACCVFELNSDYQVSLRSAWSEHILGCTVADRVVNDAIQWNEDGLLSGIVIEDKSSGSTALQTLWQRHDWIASMTYGFNPDRFGSKLIERPQRAAIWCNRDCVLLPIPCASCPWLMDFEQNLGNFPHCANRDLMDAFAQLIIFLEHYLAEGWRVRTGLENLAIEEEDDY